jgi:hypothetical protein
MFAECENRQERLFLGKDKRILQIYHGTVSENIMHEMKKCISYILMTICTGTQVTPSSDYQLKKLKLHLVCLLTTNNILLLFHGFVQAKFPDGGVVL